MTEWIIQNIPITQIEIPDRLRKLKNRDSLKESIQTNGLQTPIILRAVSTNPSHTPYSLIDGHHRLSVFQELGLPEIPARVLEVPEEAARLIEIDTNLMCTELTAIEKAEHLAKREEIYIQMNPEAKPEELKKQNLKQKDASQKTTQDIKSFTKDTADTLHKSQRHIQQYLSLYKNINPPLFELLKDSSLSNSFTVLLKIARYSKELQEKLYQAIVEEKPSNLRSFIKKYVSKMSHNNAMHDQVSSVNLDQPDHDLLDQKEKMKAKIEQLSQKIKADQRELEELQAAYKIIQQSLQEKQDVSVSPNKDTNSTTEMSDNSIDEQNVLENQESVKIEDNDSIFNIEELDDNNMLLKPCKTTKRNGKTNDKRKSYVINGWEIPLQDSYLSITGLQQKQCFKEVIKLAKKDYNLEVNIKK